jgi:hypothetical protein
VPLPRARYHRADDVIEIDGGGRLWVGEDGGLVGSRAAAGNVSLASLRAAVQRADRYLGTGPEVDVILYDAPEGLLVENEDAFLAPSVNITVLPDRCLVTCSTVADKGMTFERNDVVSKVWPALDRGRLLVVDFSTWDEPTSAVAHLTMEVRGRARTAEDALSAAEDVLALWEACASNGLSPATVRDLVRSDRAELLEGQPETEWFEVKRAPYRLEDPLEALEMAKDVAAMGNTANGGVLIIGLATRKRGDQDVVTKVRPVPTELISPTKYRRVVHRLVYPVPEAMLIERVEVEPGKGLLIMTIPAQPPEVRPLLVLGAVKEGKVVGSFVMIVRRHGDAVIATQPAALHSLIAAGRAALVGAGTEGPSACGSEPTPVSLDP